MRIAITGHTKGLGLAIYNHFVAHGHTVLGFSRSNGYSLPEKYAEVVEAVKTCDYFFNNAHVDDIQATFIRDLHDDTNIITSGSMAANFPKMHAYASNKLKIQEEHIRHRRISSKNMLLLKMGFLENYVDKYPIPYKTVLKIVDFWMDNPRISMVEVENDRLVYKQLEV